LMQTVTVSLHLVLRRSYVVFDQNVSAPFSGATKYLEQSQFH
jgi:hypothetical protein